jgi:hypothetical protein
VERENTSVVAKKRQEKKKHNWHAKSDRRRPLPHTHKNKNYYKTQQRGLILTQKKTNKALHRKTNFD